MNDERDHSRFSDRLEPGERVLWTGRPARGVIFRNIDGLLVPVSGIWFAGAASWTWEIFASGAPESFKVVAVGFAIVGFYLAFGRFLTDAHLRSQSYYAITDRRALILGGVAGKDIASFNRPAAEKVSLRETTGDRSTIQFGNSWPLIRWHATYWREPEFFRTSNAHEALELLRGSSV